MAAVKGIQPRVNPVSTALQGVQRAAGEVAKAAERISQPGRLPSADDAVQLKTARTSYKAQVTNLGKMLEMDEELMRIIA